jgi:hypothetical protein
MFQSAHSSIPEIQAHQRRFQSFDDSTRRFFATIADYSGAFGMLGHHRKMSLTHFRLSDCTP